MVCNFSCPYGICISKSSHARCGNQVFLRHSFKNQIRQHGFRLSIVKGFADDLCSVQKRNGILLCNFGRMCFKLYIRIDFSKIIGKCLGFELPDLRNFILLSMQICNIHFIEVN